MVEQGVKPQETEGAKEPTPSEKEPTDEKTRTEKEFQMAVSKGLESMTKQHSIQQQATEVAKADSAKHLAGLELAKTQISEITREIDDLAEKQFAEDPDARKAFVDRRAIAEEKRVAATMKAEALSDKLEASKVMESYALSQKANVLVKETGIDVKDLESCTTEAEMKIKALEHRLANPPKTEEPETPKFDSATSTGSGGGLGDMSPKDRTKEADGRLRQANK